MPIEITTNNVPRDIINAWGLIEDERKEFDFIDWVNVVGDNPQSSPKFFRYKGELYYLEAGEGQLPDSDWYYISQSYSFGICFRFPANEQGTGLDYERVVVGMYYAG
jgi:hypothetical protein